jgi:hypothetical protein
LSSKYKYTGPITSNHQQRDFKRWVIVYEDGKELPLARKSYAIMAAKKHLKMGDNIHLYEEMVFRSFCNNQFSDESYRIDMTDRMRIENLEESLNVHK